MVQNFQFESKQTQDTLKLDKLCNLILKLSCKIKKR